jgi:TrmH family RNA methyltransferase
MKITLLLYQTENPENLGSIARAASNFDFTDIILIDPKCNVTAKSRWLAKHGAPTLDAMRVADSAVLNEFDLLVATSGVEATALNMYRAPITPRDLGERLREEYERGSTRRVGVLFGPEGMGLSKDLLARADIVLSIPTSRDNPSMNLAQSVTIILYELSLIRGVQNKITLPYHPMNQHERDALHKAIDETLAKMHFKTNKQRETQRIVWRHALGRAFLTRREYRALMGYFKKVWWNYEERPPQ